MAARVLTLQKDRASRPGKRLPISLNTDRFRTCGMAGFDNILGYDYWGMITVSSYSIPVMAF